MALDSSFFLGGYAYLLLPFPVLCVLGLLSGYSVYLKSTRTSGLPRELCWVGVKDEGRLANLRANIGTIWNFQELLTTAHEKV
jgi:hypothetical protein